MKTSLRAFALALVLPLALAACRGDAPAPPATPATTAPAPSSAPRMENGVQVAEITIGPEGYAPAQVELQAGVPARLVFTRTTEQTCATEIKVPALNVAAVALPLGTPTAVEFTPDRDGTFAFTCGMDMLSGNIVVGS